MKFYDIEGYDKLRFENFANRRRKPADLSKMLECDENFENYFITNEMKDMYINQNNIDKILSNRKLLILEAEETFVEKLEIVDYNN